MTHYSSKVPVSPITTEDDDGMGLAYEEENAVWYMAGYVVKQLRKKMKLTY